MAEAAKLRTQYVEVGKQCGLQGSELAKYVSDELQRHEKLKMEKELEEKKLQAEKELQEKKLQAEIDNTEKKLQAEKELDEKKLQAEIDNKEKDRLQAIEMKKLENELELRRMELGVHPETPTVNASPSAEANIEASSLQTGAMAFPLEQFSEQHDSIEAYLHRFETMCSVCGLEESKWCIKLSQGLRGIAYAVFSRLRQEEHDNYEVLKQALLARFEVDSESYKKKFKNARKESGENFAQFIDRLKTYLHKWGTLGKFEETYEGLQEMIIIDQLKDKMSTEMKAFLTQHGAEKLEAIITMAERFERSQKESERNRRTTITPTHDNTPKPKEKNSNSYSKQNDKAKTTTQNKNQHAWREGKLYCYKCRITGHHTKDCQRKSLPYTAACMATQGAKKVSTDGHHNTDGHKDTSTRLPVVESVTLNGFPTTCLYDTGLQFDAIVSTSLVYPDQVTEETVEIQGPLKSSVPMLLPVAKVSITSRYVTGEIRAAVLDDPIYPVMLGCRYVFLGDPIQPVTVAAMTTRQQAKEAPASTTPINPQPEELKQAQAADSTLAACFQKLPKAHSPPRKGEVYMKNGLLHRRAGKEGQEFAQLVVPSSYRAQILDMGHSLTFSGHMGINATTQRISTHYYWPGMNADIVRYVKSCPQCQRVAPKHWTAPATLGEMPITGTPFEKVAVDIVGPLNRTKRRNCYILTLVDTCSMWAEAIPMPSSDSKHVAEALLGIFTRLGFPLRILTDNGSQFRGKLMEEVFRLFQSRQIHTSPYHPASNGTVERFNGTLITILRKLAQDKPETWDTYVPAALFAYREVPHHSTGIAPATLLFGRPIKGPLEALLRTWTDDQADETVVTASTYVAELKQRLQHGWRLASDNLRQARRRIARYYNKKAKDRELEVGEKVLLLLPTSLNKLQIGWKGPYEVIEKISRTNYKISIRGKQKIYHINLLRKYMERPTTETAHLMALAVATEVDHGTTMGVEYTMQATETYRDVEINPTLTKDQQQQVEEFLATYAEVLTDKPGLTDLAEFDMKLLDPTPVRVRTYPVPYAKANALREEIQQMLSTGIISPSESPYSASVVLLRKPSGEHRLCIDYRQLNAITEFQAEPLPDQNKLFTSLHKAKYFTRIDLSKGYYQIPVKQEVRPWLAFSTPDGHYEFNVLPFGLSNAPSVFTRMMRKLLDPIQHPGISNFMDDILIATETFDDHIKALHLLFQRLEETGLTARPKKCQIGFHQLDFLGHTISQGCMTPHEKNIEKLQLAPRPKTKKDVRSFVSLCGFYQKYIQDFNSLTAPLTNLTRKGEPEKVIWSAECENAYSALKKALSDKPVLHLPDLNRPFILRTDASNIGIGATLLQRKEDEHSALFPVAYASRKLNSAERNYSTIERECLALVWAVEKFQAYLYGKHFTIQSDHQPLMFLSASKNLNARLMRWSLLLQPYSFQMEYIPGKMNVGADFLSRHPVSDTSTVPESKGNNEDRIE